MTGYIFPYGRLIFFATENVHKFDEARRLLAEYDISTAMLKIRTLEIQDDHPEKIAKRRARDAANKTNLPLIVEDAGLFVNALNCFPGPYSSYTYQRIGNEGILRLLEPYADRRAHFRSIVAFWAPRIGLRCFNGLVEGKITDRIRGSLGFGFDPIFEPSKHQGKTFGELSTEEKNKISHRARALKKFAKWYKQIR